MKRLLKAAPLFLALTVSATVLADPAWLVTPDEAARDWKRSQIEDAPRVAKSFVPGAPDLALVKPANLAEPLKAPFPINLAFKAKDGAAIVPESFKALYGTFRLDITDRIVRHAKVTAGGINLDKAEIPSGSHKLILQVKDDRNRQGEVELRFSVD